MSRLKTIRTVPIYPRVQSLNAKWLKENRKKFEVGQADFLDRLLTHCRKTFGARDLKKI